MSEELLYTNDTLDFLPQSPAEIDDDYDLEECLSYLDDSSLEDLSERILGKDIFEDMDREDGVEEILADAIRDASEEEREQVLIDIYPEIRDAMLDSDEHDALCQELAMENFRATMSEQYGLLKDSEDYLFLGSNMGWQSLSGYKLANVSEPDDIIDALHGNYDFTAKIYHETDKPYLEASVSSHDAPMGEGYTIVPMQWMEKALKSDIGEKIQHVMLLDEDVCDAVREAVPALTKGKEAITAIEDFVLYEAYGPFNNNKDKKHELATELASFDFLKFKDHVNPNKEYYVIAEEAFYDGNEPYDYDHYDIGKYRLPGTPDEQLVKGIEATLEKGSAEDIKKMVDGLFSKNRANTIHELKTMNKELTK